MATIEIPVIKVHQKIGELYVGVIGARDLYAVAEVDRIRLESLKVPKYAGFQRALVPERVQSIREYLKEPLATFPNAIIISLDSEYIENWKQITTSRDDYLKPNITILEIRREQGAATIIDGQHRAAALDTAQEDFKVIVSIFIDLELSRRAQIFANINSTQKAVNPSIAFQLFGYAEERSLQRTAHDIAGTLNTTEGAPFYKRLRMLGTKDDWSIGTLSQSTFCKELMKFYSKRPDQWSPQATESILVKTTGYSALVAVLKQWLLSSRRDEVLNDTEVRELLDQIKEAYQTPERRFVRKNYPAGNQGVQILRDSLNRDLRLE